jgi:hypothetical protein
MLFILCLGVPAGEDLIKMVQHEQIRRQQAEDAAKLVRDQMHATESLRTMQALQIGKLGEELKALRSELMQYQNGSSDLVRPRHASRLQG